MTLEEINKLNQQCAQQAQAIQDLEKQVKESEDEIEKKEKECLEDVEKLNQSASVSSTTSSVSSKQSGGFYIGYNRANTHMEQVKPEELKEYFLSHGAIQLKNKKDKLLPQYQIKIDGDTYIYDTETESLTINGKNYLGCRFYKTPKTSLGNITNTITLLPGSGEQHKGAVLPDSKRDHISPNANINDGCLIIAPYRQHKRDSDVNLFRYGNEILSTTKLGNFLSNGSTNSQNHVKNSLLGNSFGGTAALAAASAAPKGYYSTVVGVNVGSYIAPQSGPDYDTLTPADYQKIKDMEIIFLSTPDEPGHARSIRGTITNLLNAGAKNVKLYTNFTEFQQGGKYGINGYNPIMVDEWNHIMGKYNAKEIPIYVFNKKQDNATQIHSFGYRLIEDTNILSYLSSI